MTITEAKYLRDWGTRLRSEADNAPLGTKEIARKSMLVAARALFDGADTIDNLYAEELIAQGNARVRRQIKGGIVFE